MRRQKFLAGWEYYVFGPIVVVLVVFAVWVSVAATVGTYRAAQANAQIMDIIAKVRDMKIPNDAVAERMAKELFRRLSVEGNYEVVQIKGAFLGADPEQGVLNPWGGAVRVFFYPSMSSFRIETAVSSLGCRKILLNLSSKDNAVVKLRRVDIKEDDPARLWGLVYEERKNTQGKTIHPNVIYNSCGTDKDNLLSLTFYQ